MALHLSIRGVVQGVGYRESMCYEAERLGIRGWVRNRRDGSVEALIDGDTAAMDAMLAWARRGPPAARVIDVVNEEAAALDPSHKDFRRLPTA